MLTADHWFPVNLRLPRAVQECEHVSNEAVKGRVLELLKSHNLDTEDAHTSPQSFPRSRIPRPLPALGEVRRSHPGTFVKDYCWFNTFLELLLIFKAVQELPAAPRPSAGAPILLNSGLSCCHSGLKTIGNSRELQRSVPLLDPHLPGPWSCIAGFESRSSNGTRG